jgi:hypothetical protein
VVGEEDAAGEGRVGAGGGAGGEREWAESHRSSAGRGQRRLGHVDLCPSSSSSHSRRSFELPPRHGPGAAHPNYHRCLCCAGGNHPSRHLLSHHHHLMPSFPCFPTAAHPASLLRARTPARSVRGLSQSKLRLPHPHPPASARLLVSRRQ